MLTFTTTTAATQQTRHALAPSLSQRASALGLALVVTFSLLGGVSEIADVQQQSAKAEWLAAQSDAADPTPLQTIVITGHRIAKA